MTKELIISKDLTPAIFFQKDNNGVLEVVNEVANLQKKVDAFDADVNTKKGQAAIRTFAATLASSKVALDNLGKDAVDGWNKQAKAVNKVRTTTKEAVQLMQDTVRKPLTDFEDAEKLRVKTHSDGVNQIRESGEYHQLNWQEIAVENMEAQLVEIKGLDDGTWEEFNDAAVKNIKDTVEKIEASIAKKTQYDKDQADLAALRIANEEREQKERDEKIANDAVEKFKAKEVAAAIVEVIDTPKETPKEVFYSRVIPKTSPADDKYIVQENMQKYGGVFVKALGVALSKADSQNTARIETAFADYWGEFLHFTDAT